MPLIHEGVIVTSGADGGAHVTPMGFRRQGDIIEIAPFAPSQTLTNLHVHGRATMNLTDDVRIVAGCLTGRRQWPLADATRIEGARLADCLAHLELVVDGVSADAERPRFTLHVVHEAMHRAFSGFNRAQAAVIEAAILVSRLDFIDPGKLAREMNYLHIAVAKTAGDTEWTAWRWLLEAIDRHPRHALDCATLATADAVVS
ncbi:MAG: DUF447 domain-containing protein [Gammaproteobacteria bacterium]